MSPQDLYANPLGTDGFEFIEFTGPDPQALGQLFESMGFTAVARHRSKDVLLYRQGGINYEALNDRVSGHGESLERRRDLRILVDGAPTQGQGLLLQIFTENVIGPCFFEIIQRKGNESFGEGNFKALFESLELDQIRRGVLSADANTAETP
jgi:4-hydroxyphenylpyruvate dioxygenase